MSSENNNNLYKKLNDYHNFLVSDVLSAKAKLNMVMFRNGFQLASKDDLITKFIEKTNKQKTNAERLNTIIKGEKLAEEEFSSLLRFCKETGKADIAETLQIIVNQEVQEKAPSYTTPTPNC